VIKARAPAGSHEREASRESKAMIDEDEVRKSLLAKRAELAQRVGRTQATERQEVAEGQNDNAQLWEVSDVRDDLDTQAATELEQVNQALARLDAGEYGLCMDCEEPIAEARLKALPYATLCIQCAEEAEQSS
jgi:RNA polymerase-binding transcription factor DksA